MRRFRFLLPVGMVIVSGILAFLLRDVAYELIVVPLAYILWLVRIYYSAIPQLLIWGLLMMFLFVGVTWKLIPDAGPSPRRRIQHLQREGQVESLAMWILRGRSSNYFKWQVANRLARLARRETEGWTRSEVAHTQTELVRKYLAAGMNQSFVDFPASPGPFQRRIPTALDLDPNEAVQYLESRMESSRDRGA